MFVIEAKDLVKKYHEKIALNHFNLQVKEGEILGLLGPNGCGKTTAIHTILGLLKIEKGEVLLFGKQMNHHMFEIKKKIGVVPQELAYFEELTVKENIDFFCGLYVEDSLKRKELVEEAIRFVELDEYRNFIPKKLSGGLKRRLNIACGIVHQPRLIFFDEPTVAVDAHSRSFILEGIKRLNQNGTTIVYTTHYLDEADYLCDRIVIMDNGEYIVSGTSDELKQLIALKEIISVELVDEPSEEFLKVAQQLNGLQLCQVQNRMMKFEFKQSGHQLAKIVHLLEDFDLPYVHISSEKPSLQDVFLAYTGKELRD